jgi:hypothetical protein
MLTVADSALALQTDAITPLSKTAWAVRYQSDWRHFCAWCESRGLRPLPAAADAVAAYSPIAPGA